MIVKPLSVDLASNCEKIPITAYTGFETSWITETMRYFPVVFVEHGLQHSKLVKADSDAIGGTNLRSGIHNPSS